MRLLWGWVQGGKQAGSLDPSGMTPHLKEQSLSPLSVLCALPSHCLFNVTSHSPCGRFSLSYTLLHPSLLNPSPSVHVTYVDEAFALAQHFLFFLTCAVHDAN